MLYINQITLITHYYIVEEVNKERTSRDIGQEIGHSYITIS